MSEGISKYSPYSPKEHLRELRYDWSDEIPDRIIHSIDEDNKFKVRTGWFTGVTADVENALRKGNIKNPQGRTAAKQLIERFSSEEWLDREINTKDDIQEANRLIDIILSEEEF